MTTGRINQVDTIVFPGRTHAPSLPRRNAGCQVRAPSQSKFFQHFVHPRMPKVARAGSLHVQFTHRSRRRAELPPHLTQKPSTTSLTPRRVWAAAPGVHGSLRRTLHPSTVAAPTCNIQFCIANLMQVIPNCQGEWSRPGMHFSPLQVLGVSKHEVVERRDSHRGKCQLSAALSPSQPTVG